jgi:hypothetical protein
MALQAAEDAGTLAPQSAVQASMVAYHQTVKRIEQFRAMLDRTGKPRAAAPEFSLLLVDVALWSRIVPHPEGFQLVVHTDRPASDEPAVLTVDAVLRAVLDGRLSASEALNRGLVRVEAPIDAKLKLFDLIAAAQRS